MEETITKYIATITKGDEYHSEGEDHILTSWGVEAVQRTGLQLEVKKNNWGDVFYHIYPCTIKKIVYRIEPIEISSIEGGDTMKGEIIRIRGAAERDGKEH